jgi:ribosomal protein S18 acetylase RimI-like enzyme
MDAENAPDHSSRSQKLDIPSVDLSPNPFHAASFPVSLSVYRSSQLLPQDLVECFDLIKLTSSAEYKASSMGWHPKNKKDEMADKAMWYILVRRAEAQPDPPPVNGSSPPPYSNPVLGFLSFMFTHDDPPYTDRTVVYIYEIHLSESLRGSGLGSHLIQKAEGIAKSTDVSKTMLTVFSSNKGARRLYERLGYTKDQCSPADREIRGRVIEADYVIMSNELGEGTRDLQR